MDLLIQNQLDLIDVDLNIPSFLEGRGKLPAIEVLEGHKIASVRVHVERAINRIKCFSILKGTLPIALYRIANQITGMYGMLVNFQPVLIPPPVGDEDISKVEEYFQSMYSSDTEYDADCDESSDEENE